MPRREKSRLERLGDIANYLKRAKEEAQAIDLRETPAGARNGVKELRKDLDALGETLISTMQAEARASLSLDRAERLTHQD